MSNRVVEVEIEEFEIGNEAFVIAGKITFEEVYDTETDGEEPCGAPMIVDWKEVEIEIGVIQRMSVKGKYIDLPANRRARMILKHGQEIKKALREKLEADQEDASEAMADR